jgi:undecaprenyl-diphosphatase
LIVAGALLRPVLNGCHSPLRGLIVIGVASIAMSVLLAVAERAARHTRSFSQLTLYDGVWVGLAQGLALIPGVSRSGATLTAALFRGMERETAARFSFLLGLPAVTLAGFYELHVLAQAGLGSPGWITLLIDWERPVSRRFSQSTDCCTIWRSAVRGSLFGTGSSLAWRWWSGS